LSFGSAFSELLGGIGHFLEGLRTFTAIENGHRGAANVDPGSSAQVKFAWHKEEGDLSFFAQYREVRNHLRRVDILGYQDQFCDSAFNGLSALIRSFSDFSRIFGDLHDLECLVSQFFRDFELHVERFWHSLHRTFAKLERKHFRAFYERFCAKFRQ
jgi:hypothetical protein